MKILAGLTFAGFMMVVSASAATVDIAVLCGTDGTLKPAGTTSGQFICPSFASLGIGGGVTLASEFIDYNNDYSIGGVNGATVQTVFNFLSGSPLQYATDTLTSTGGANSNPATCTSILGGPVNPQQTINGAVVPVGCTNTVGSPYGVVTINYTQSVTAGSATSATLDAYVVFDYNTSTTTPEPVSMLLMGGGLLALSFIGRKRFAKR
jgi:hypothetical protein